MTETDAFTKVTTPHTAVDFHKEHSHEKIIYVPAFGGDFNPGLHKQSKKNFANPAPLGLCAFACTLFVLSLINANTRGVSKPNIAVGLAYGYGGLVQLLAGMWEMAIGNTFGATALTSYAGFWLSYAVMQSNDLFGIFTAYGTDVAQLYNAIGLYIVGWFIFTTIMLICTLRSTVAFFALFLCIDVTFILMANSYFKLAKGEDPHDINKAAGIIGCIASFLAWWCALAGILDSTNSFFKLPVLHFPWSIKPEDVNKKGK